MLAMPSKQRGPRRAGEAGAAGGDARGRDEEWEDLWALEALESLVAGRQGKKEYRFRFYTGDKEGQADAPVAYLNLIGDKGESGERPLSHATFLAPPSTTEPAGSHAPGASVRARGTTL